MSLPESRLSSHYSHFTAESCLWPILMHQSIGDCSFWVVQSHEIHHNSSAECCLSTLDCLMWHSPCLRACLVRNKTKLDSFGIIREGPRRVGRPDCIVHWLNKSSPHYRRVAINSTEEKTEVTFLYKVPSRLRRYTLGH